jgi:putative colanic acid biosysnthesis UDP-glucose lipid carrier transferase
MTEPVLFRGSFQIALMTGLQTVAPPVAALAWLYATVMHWDISFRGSPVTLAVVTTLTVLILARSPRDLSTQLATRQPIIARILLQWLLVLVLALGAGLATLTLQLYPGQAILVWAAGTPLVLIAVTLVTQGIMRRMLIEATDNRRVIIAGYNDASMQLAQRLQNSPSLPMTVQGFFDDRGADRLQLEPNVQLLGGLSDLAAYTKQNSIDVIFIALPIRHLKRVLDLLDDLRDTTASIYYVPDIVVFDLIQARSGELHGIPVVAMCETPFYGYRGVTKRLTDVILSLGVLVLSVPLFAIVALLVRLSSPGPVIFRQRRYGLDGREIIVYKFRTMTVTEDGSEVRQASKSDSRVTRIGAWLRRSSIDEIPQFINVLQGRMSLVGPRPHAVVHNEQYRKLIKGYMVRHKVLPGITGLAQINGARGETSNLEDMEARVRFDLDYLRHWSPMLDIKILVLTVLRLFRDNKAY